MASTAHPHLRVCVAQATTRQRPAREDPFPSLSTLPVLLRARPPLPAPAPPPLTLPPPRRRRQQQRAARAEASDMADLDTNMDGGSTYELPSGQQVPQWGRPAARGWGGGAWEQAGRRTRALCGQGTGWGWVGGRAHRSGRGYSAAGALGDGHWHLHAARSLPAGMPGPAAPGPACHTLGPSSPPPTHTPLPALRPPPPHPHPARTPATLLPALPHRHHLSSPHPLPLLLLAPAPPAA